METSIGERIKQLRERSGLSQEELGNRMGVTKSYISKLENGKKKLNKYDRILQVANALNVHISEIIPDEEKLRVSVDDEEWSFLLGELKAEGLTAEQVREYVKIAKKHIKRDEEK